jgi:hypothetical protein
LSGSLDLSETIQDPALRPIEIRQIDVGLRVCRRDPYRLIVLGFCLLELAL